MSENRPNEPWIGPEFFENRWNFPAEELLKYAGQHVAFSWDGARIEAADPDEEQLFRKLEAAGIDISRVVFDYLDDGRCSRIG